MPRRWLLVSLAAVGVAVAVALVLLLTAGTPVAIGGADVADVRGARFTGTGDLINNQSLLDDAAGAWRDDTDLPDAVHALWAGRTEQGRVVILQSGDKFRAVQFSDGGEPALGDARIVGDSFVVSQAGVLVARGLSDRWRAMSLGDDDVGRVAGLTAQDDLVPVDAESLLALVPITVDERRAVPVLMGTGGRLAATRVDPRDWPRFRDALTDGLFAPFVAAAFGVAAGDAVLTRHTRLLHIGEVPGEDIGVALSTAVDSRVMFGWASGNGRSPDTDLLGVAVLGRPALVARSVERDVDGPWLVVAGSPDVESISIRGSGERSGNFALLSPSRRDAGDVRGTLESGRVVRVAP